MRHELETRITIDAPPEVVWRILVGVEAYEQWNPFIVSSSGTVAVGERLVNRMQPAGGRAMTFKPTVTELQPQQVFEWLGRLGLPRIFDGRHRFELRANADGSTELVHSEEFRGLLVRLARSGLDDGTRAGFEAMNAAMKARAEALVAAS